MLTTVLGILVIVLGLICWLGQALVVFAPRVAVMLGLYEREEDLDRSMYLFERLSQGIMDVLLAWMLPAAALMMLLGNKHWLILARARRGRLPVLPRSLHHHPHRLEEEREEHWQALEWFEEL